MVKSDVIIEYQKFKIDRFCKNYYHYNISLKPIWLLWQLIELQTSLHVLIIITMHIYTSCTIIYYSNNANMINFRFQRLQIHVCWKYQQNTWYNNERTSHKWTLSYGKQSLVITWYVFSIMYLCEKYRFILISINIIRY